MLANEQLYFRSKQSSNLGQVILSNGKNIFSTQVFNLFRESHILERLSDMSTQISNVRWKSYIFDRLTIFETNN